MTISSEVLYNTYTGDASTTAFAFSFPIEDESDIRVVLYDTDDSSYTTQTITTDYTISGSGNTSGNTDYTSGTVTFNTAPGTDKIILIDRGNITLTQTLDVIENSTLTADALENALDRLDIMIQQNKHINDLSLKLDANQSSWSTQLPPATADYVLAANSSGDGFTWSDLSSTAGLASVAADTSPQLGGALDTNAFNIQFDDGKGITSTESSNPELMLFTSVASAINYINITNSATGNYPIIEGKGDDTAVGIDLLTKGAGGSVNIKADSGNPGKLELFDDDDSQSIGFEAPSALSGTTSFVLPDGDGSANQVITTDGAATLSWSGVGSLVSPAFNIPGTSSSAASIQLAEDTDNGSNYMEIKAPAAVTSDTTLTLPDGDGSANTALITNGSGTLSWSTMTVAAATQAEQETGTSTTVAVTPGRQHYHESACKAWCKADAAGNVQASYNVTSVTDDSTGFITFTWDTDFSSANYVAVSTPLHNADIYARINAQAAGTAQVVTLNSTPTAVDPTSHLIAAFGDQ